MKVQRVYEVVQPWGTYQGAPTSVVEFGSEKRDLLEVAAPYVLSKLLQISTKPRYVALAGNDPAKVSANDMEALLFSLSTWVGTRSLSRVIYQTRGERDLRAVLAKHRQLVALQIVVDCSQPVTVVRNAFEKLIPTDRVIFLCPAEDGAYATATAVLSEMMKYNTCNPVVELRVRDLRAIAMMRTWVGCRDRFDTRLFVDAVQEAPQRRSAPPGGNTPPSTGK